MKQEANKRSGQDANDIGLSHKALETLVSITSPDRQPSAFDSIGKLFSCMYAPAYPDWDGDWDKYAQEFSEIYGVDNKDLLNMILSQDVWNDTAEDMNMYFTFCVFEQQILLTRKRLETWVQMHARTDPGAVERAIEKITDLEQQVKQIREYSQFLHFKLLQTVEQALAKCTKEVAEEKKAANKMNANFVLQGILVKPPVEVPKSE